MELASAPSAVVTVVENAVAGEGDGEVPLAPVVGFPRRCALRADRPLCAVLRPDADPERREDFARRPHRIIGPPPRASA